jgi:hypothetical protein
VCISDQGSGSLSQQHNQEEDTRALLESSMPSAQEPPSLHTTTSTVLSRPLDLLTSQPRAPRRALISYLAYLWWSGLIRIILVRLLHSLQSMLEIATAKVCEVMHVNMQQGQ